MTVVLPVTVTHPSGLGAALEAAGVERGALLAVAVGDRVVGLASAGARIVVQGGVEHLSAVDAAVHPRWVLWDAGSVRALVAAGVRLATCWHIAAAHRLLHGGWRADPQRAWAVEHGLDHRIAPSMGQLDLLSTATAAGAAGDPADPVQPDGYLRPEWVDGRWRADGTMAVTWAGTALDLARRQRAALEAAAPSDAEARRWSATVHAESAAELLCGELEADGLPVDLAIAAELLRDMIGARPVDDAAATAARAELDGTVLRHLPPGSGIDLRNPADVRSMLRRMGIDVPDTRAWRLETLRGDHAIVDDLLRWRKVDRIASTFGYGWLDQHVGTDGRLRGEWAASDGAAGRMTAGAGLHNLPAELRPMVRAEHGHVFVRADLGQIEPRVLAAVSGDPTLGAATAEDDLYLPVARRLGVERSVAKVAVLAAMYGQTSGTAGQALRGMQSAYPTAMKYLADAAAAGETGRPLRTFGGRRLRMYSIDGAADQRAAAAGRGRYARNAMVQGAAAELFKMWAVTVRARAARGTQVVLCLHDELLLHVPSAAAADTVDLVRDGLAEAAHRWSPGSGVRFVADVSVVDSWADAKD